MSSIAAQQTKLDMELVPKEKRLDIRKCNGRHNTRNIQIEPTFQVVLDSLALTSCYSVFLITADVSEVYMHQFWDSVYKHDTFYKFKIDKRKRFKLNLEVFRDIFKICPRVQGQDFDALPTDDEIMHQSWRTFVALINRSLSGKTTGIDKLRLSRAQILYVILNGDGPIQVTTNEKGIETEVPPKTAQALLQRQKERKAKSILLLAIPDEYQLRFHGIMDEKSLNKDGIDDLDIDDLYNNLKVFKANIKGSSGSSSNSQNVAFLSAEDTSSSNESNTPQLDDEDLEQIDHDDLEEMDLKWQVLIKLRLNALTVIEGAILQGNVEHQEIKGTRMEMQDRLGYDWSYIAQDEPTEFALMAYTSNSSDSNTEANLEIIAYQLGLESVEAQLVVHQKNEVVYEEKIAVLEFEVKDKSNAVTRLKNQLDETLREKDDLKAKLEQFETSSKNLNKLINSQLNSKDKTGLGYGDQLNENDSSGSELFNSMFDSRSSDGDDNQTNDRFKKDNEYHAVPPPLTRNYMPPLADLSFAGLDDSVYRPTANKTSASVSQVETSITLPSNTSVEMPRVESVRPSRVIIEDWVSDDDEDIFQSNDLQATDKPSFKKIEFTNAKIEYVKPKQAEKPRITTQNPKRMAKKSVLKNMGKNTGQREIRPVWNNVQRINHQNKFVPSAVLTRSGKVQVSTAKKSSLRATTSTSTFRPVNTATHTNRVNVSKLRTNAFHKSHSPIRRSFYKPTTPNTRILNEKVNTARVNGVNTTGQTAVSAVKGNRVTALKASAGCVWRPKMTHLNNVSKDNSGSWVSKKGNPQQALKNKGIFDSGCSRHMTGIKDFLIDYQDIDEGFVAFGGSARGELKFNLFPVSQMCDKKNSVLFTEIECLVLSPDFKLLDAIQVLLRVPRQSNMYSFDLKNDVPSGNLTCLKHSVDAGQSKEKNVSTQQYVVFPLWSSISSSYKSSDENDTADDSAGESHVQKPASENEHALKNVLDKMMDQEKEATEQSDAIRKDTPVNAASASRTYNDAGPSFVPLGGSFPDDPLIPDLEDTAEVQNGIFGSAYDDEDLDTYNSPYADQVMGAEADFNNMESSTVV
ncbi:hypothetical protein Tco_0489648, partial [Tanacetum coccineum]